MKSAAHHLELLALGERLRRYAGGMQADQNAAFLLVHEALSAAFQGDPEPGDGPPLEVSLRQDIDRAFAASRRRKQGPDT